MKDPIDRLGDIIILLVGILHLIIIVLMALESLFTLILTVPLTAFAIMWLRRTDWDEFLS